MYKVTKVHSEMIRYIIGCVNVSTLYSEWNINIDQKQGQLYIL